MNLSLRALICSLTAMSIYPYLLSAGVRLVAANYIKHHVGSLFRDYLTEQGINSVLLISAIQKGF